MDVRRQYDFYTLGKVKFISAQNWDAETNALLDWAAYAGPSEWLDEEVAAHGSKLTVVQAKAFFDQKYLPGAKYRD